MTRPVTIEFEFNNSNNSMLYLSRQNLESLDIKTEEMLTQLEILLKAQAAGSVQAAPKAALATADGRYLMATLSTCDDPPLMAVKGVIVNQENAKQGLEAINGSIMLLNSQTGVPVAYLDGNWITAVRTAAASALAARYLANAESSVMTFIGTGVQSRAHLKLFSSLYPINEIRALGRGTRSRDVLCDTASKMGLKAIPCDDASSAVDDADIIVSSIPITSTVDPFIDAGWLKQGVFVSSTDLALPWIAESMKAFDRIIIDDLIQEAAMPEPMVEIELVGGDITGLVSGTVSGRQTPTERTAFVFRAVALGDLALASLVYQKAVSTGVGFEIPS
ncbi:MAG: ornithine cyclodeaminase family protein [Arenicellales bacterium]